MQCPVCGGRAIGFRDWCSNALSHTCDACGARLVANAVTVAGFALSLVAGAVAVVVAVLAFGMTLRRNRAGFLVAVPPILAFAGLTWFLGGYRAAVERGSRGG